MTLNGADESPLLFFIEIEAVEVIHPLYSDGVIILRLYAFWVEFPFLETFNFVDGSYLKLDCCSIIYETQQDNVSLHFGVNHPIGHGPNFDHQKFEKVWDLARYQVNSIPLSKVLFWRTNWGED